MSDHHPAPDDRPTEGRTRGGNGTAPEPVVWKEQLAETRRRLDTVVGNLPGLAYRCRNDAGWTMEYLSDGCKALTGYEPEELIGNRSVAYGDLILPEDRAPVWEGVQAAIDGGRHFQLEYRIRRRDGEVRWVWEQGLAIAGSDADGRGTLALEGIIHDVTKRRVAEKRSRALEAQMRAAQRMETVARVAGRVAHDFNNILMVIRSCAHFLQTRLGPDDRAHKDLGTIEDAVDRGAGLVRQLMAFGRQGEQALEDVDLSGTVYGMEPMLLRVVGKDVALILDLADDMRPLRADNVQLEQVLMNLVVNARDAMPRGGELKVATMNVEVDEGSELHTQAGLKAGHYAVLAVSDTGLGMDEGTRARVFEPFFTTKPINKGTGLGLSTVWGIADESGGHVRVDSAPGKGATFRVYLPNG